MANRFVISLVVSGFRMLMRFPAMRLLGGLMYGMMMRTKAYPQERGQSNSITQDRGSRGGSPAKREEAAIAVAPRWAKQQMRVIGLPCTPEPVKVGRTLHPHRRLARHRRGQGL